MQDEIMLDLETMGIKPGSAIISIGACTLDGRDTFYSPIFLESCLPYGLTKDPSTESWWSKQSEEARKVLSDPDRIEIGPALMGFADWIRRVSSPGKVKVWGNGSDFDNVLLTCAYDALGFDAPWRFYNNRCFRTAKALGPKVDLPREGVHHNALDDALHQTRILNEIRR